MTFNDVIDYARFYRGKDEPPPFYHEIIDPRGKLFVPVDDAKLGFSLTDAPTRDIILHHFVHDSKQNRLVRNPMADAGLHGKVFAVTSPDFSVDSDACWSCLNEGNILKSRICASRWQSERGESVILTLQWGRDEETFRWAFGNVERGSVVAVSTQGVADAAVFESGMRTAIDTIQPDFICWYGRIPGFMSGIYDDWRIVRMQKRASLVCMRPGLGEKREAESMTLPFIGSE